MKIYKYQYIMLNAICDQYIAVGESILDKIKKKIK